jgi:hypothetical protein
MRKAGVYRVTATAVAALLIGSTAASARHFVPSAKCARPDELSAIQAAAIQQQLMVGALTCNEIPRFNTFQTSFGPELRASDASLSRMFKRLYGARQGEAEYHAFKTRLANDSSIRSIHDNTNYCQQTGGLFTAALAAEKPTLVSFVSVVQVVEESPVSSCQLRVAAGAAAPIPNVVPRPRPEVASVESASATGLPATSPQ